MSRIKLLALRARVRAREEKYWRKHRYYVRKGKKLKKGSAAQKHNAARRKHYAELYQHSRTRRRGLDKQLSRLPIASVDQAGIDFIIREEGVRLEPYNDSLGYATVGVGHLLHKSNVTASDRARYAHFTRADADALLARDLDRFEKVVADTFKGASLPVTQHRFNACVSLAFNIGEAGFARSTVARQIRAGNLHGAAEAFRMWRNPSVLGPRREREIALFLHS
jgi:lysozyme